MIRIAIDGPGGAGKSSLAKEVAKALGIIYVDTGALYRTIGLYMLKHGIDPSDADKVIPALDEFSLELAFANGKQTILLNGVDFGDSIRTPEVSMAASAVSAIPAVREYLLNTQRDTAKKNSVIMDGRDIGTVILPDAEVKIFLTATPQARAKRRYEELIARGQDVTYEQVYKEMVERDTNDSTRAVAPCVPAKDAVILDNSRLTPKKTVKKVLSIISKKQKKLMKKNGYMRTRAILAPLVNLFTKIEVTGAENIPATGGYLLCSNHIAKRDVVMLGIACPRQIKFIAKKELFSIPVLSSIMRAFGAVGLDRGGTDVAALRTSVDLLKGGDIVAIFPQGHRYPKVNPAKTPTKSGAGLIAYRAKCPVIPVCILTRGNKYRLFQKVEVIFGKPIAYDELGFVNGGNEEYASVTSSIFSKIVELGGFNALPAPQDNQTEKGE